MLRRAFGVVLCLWWVASVVHAQTPTVVESRETIADRKTRGAFERLGERGLHLPETLATDQDVYVLVRQGGAYTDVRVLGRTTVPAKKLAEALGQVLHTHKAIGLEGPVTYADDDEFHAAQLQTAQGRLGAATAENQVAVGELVRGLEQAGYHPHALLAVPRYAQLKLGGTERKPDISGEKFLWWDISQEPLEREASVTVALDPLAPALVAGFLLFVPIIGVFGLLAALWVGQASHIPLERRRPLYLKLAMYPTFGAIALHMPFALWFMRSTQIQQLTDLWFGSNSLTGALGPLLMIGPLSLLLILPFANKREKQLFGNDEVKAELPPDVVAEAERIKEVRMRIFKLSLIPMALGLAILLGSRFFPIPRSAARYLPIVGLLIAKGGAFFVQYLFRDQLKSVTVPPVQDSALSERLLRLISDSGAPVREVLVDQSATGRTTPTITLLSGKLTISQRLCDILTPEQLDFVALREVVAQKGNPVARTLLLVLPISLLAILPLQLRLFGLGTTAEPWRTLFMVVPFLSLGALFFVMPQVQRKKLLEADRLALAQTRNLRAAEGALTALAANSPMPYLEEASTPLSGKPALEKRLAALRQAASALDLR